MAYEHERDEWRDALRGNAGDCYRHDFRPNRQGGGTCVGCGLTIEAGEL